MCLDHIPLPNSSETHPPLLPHPTLCPQPQTYQVQCMQPMYVWKDEWPSAAVWATKGYVLKENRPFLSQHPSLPMVPERGWNILLTASHHAYFLFFVFFRLEREQVLCVLPYRCEFICVDALLCPEDTVSL